MVASGTQMQKDEQLATVQQLQVSLTEIVEIGGFWTDVTYPLCVYLQAETDARIAEIQQQLRERDAEIKRLQRELRVRKTMEYVLWVLSRNMYC